ncbi:MAG: hypothetical protein Q9222_005361 [Ikaeria aurantiellina]
MIATLGWVAALASLTDGIVYRLYLSPISKFPGRKTAALTFWYEFYYDVFKGGRYIWEIEQMHRVYGTLSARTCTHPTELHTGPIVRINPRELHISDPSFMKQLYPSVAKNVEKWSWSAGMFGSNKMTFGTIGHDLHKLRRQAFGNLFSKQSIRNLEPRIQIVVNTLTEQLAKCRGTREIVNLGQIFSALTQDIISEYCFAKNRNCLLMPNFGPSYGSLMEKTKLCPLLKQFPLFVPILENFPEWILRRVFPLPLSLRTARKSTRQLVRNFLDTYNGTEKKLSHMTVFHAIIDDQELPSSEKTVDRLAWEAQLFIGAGTLTTAHVLANPVILEILLGELGTAASKRTGPIPLQTLEHLPYLNAVISEGLRISHSVTHRLQRVHPDTILQLGDWTIPPGTPVGMSSPLIHINESLFPKPYTFDPSRWLGPPEQAKQLQQYLFSFGKGSRACAGRDLAYAEFYMTLAAVFGRFGRELMLVDTVRERDVDPVRDYFNVGKIDT